MPFFASQLLRQFGHWLPRLERRSVLVASVVQPLLLVAALLIAYLVTFDFDFTSRNPLADLEPALWFIPLKVILLWRFGQFRVFLPYFRIPDLLRIFWAVAVSFFVALAAFYFGGLDWSFPRRVIFAEAATSILALVGFRLTCRSLWEWRRRWGVRAQAGQRRIVVIGAGYLGERILTETLSSPESRETVVALFDDDVRKAGCFLHGLRIGPVPDSFDGVIREAGAQEIIVAIAQPRPDRLRDWVQAARAAQLPLRIIPELKSLTTARSELAQVREIRIEDLLGREVIPLDNRAIEQLIAGSRVLVTGAGGSIGRELCHQILRQNPAQLVILDQAEPILYQTELSLRDTRSTGLFETIVADVTHRESLDHLLRRHQPQVIFHAAAHKHVPMMERQPAEAIFNNVGGTLTLAELAATHGVERFVLVSTDKAINPSSVMGATKRMAELAIFAAQRHFGGRTRFTAVRFGNVLGSSGSVLPLFQQQILAGGPVTVTHPQMQRYFMTIPEAVGLVLQCAAMTEGGDLFVLDMGKPISIDAVARRMIELAGLIPEVDIPIIYTGLRPGEKLFEEIVREGERVQPTTNPRVVRYQHEADFSTDWAELANALRTVDLGLPPDALKDWLQQWLPEYTPHRESTPS